MSHWNTVRSGHDWEIRWGNTLVAIARGGQESSDELTELGDGFYRWTRKVNIPTSRQAMYLDTRYACEYAMIPAVIYNGNGWGSDRDYVGFSFEGVPYKLAWHRTSVPGATYSGGSGFSAGMFCGQEGGCSLSLEENNSYRRHVLSWPEEEGPRYLVGHGQVWVNEPITVPGPERSEFVAYLVLDKVDNAKVGWYKMLDCAWKMNYHKVPCWHGLEDTHRLAMAYAKTLYTEEEDRTAYSIGFHWRNGQWEKRDGAKYEIGWCGQNASFANSMMTHYLNTGDEEARDMAIRVLDSWVEHNRLPNGLFRVQLDKLPEERLERENQDACNLGTASLQFWEAYELAEKCGIPRPVYAEVAKGIADFACSVQREDGCLGKAWHRDGSLAVAEGTVGAFFIPALLATHARTGDEKYMKAALAAHTYYMQELQTNGYTTAGALDTYCIDKESSMPLLRSSLDLYDITGDAHYLRCAEEAAWYLSTWQWHHTTPYSEKTVLGQLHYDTFGGTAVSTAHLHIDPYALYYVPELLRLAKCTGNEVWTQRAAAIWQNATQGVSDGTLVVMDKLRPMGSQDEGFTHTRFWGEFGVSQWLVAWPCAFRLEVLRRLGDEAAVLI